MDISLGKRRIVILLLILFISFQAFRIFESLNNGFPIFMPSLQLIVAIFFLIVFLLPRPKNSKEVK